MIIASGIRTAALLVVAVASMVCACGNKEVASEVVKAESPRSSAETPAAPVLEAAAPKSPVAENAKKVGVPESPAAKTVEKPEPEPAAKPETQKPDAEGTRTPETNPAFLRPDPMVVMQGKQLKTVLSDGTQIDVGTLGENDYHYAVGGHQLVGVFGNKLVSVELATGRRFVLADPLFYGIFTDTMGLTWNAEGNCMNFELGDPDTVEENENYAIFSISDSYCWPVYRTGTLVPGASAEAVCHWSDEKPEGRADVTVEDRREQFVVVVVKSDGSKLDLGAVTAFRAPKDTDAMMEQEGAALESLVTRCEWMNERRIVRCDVVQDLMDQPPTVAVWFDEETGKGGISDETNWSGSGSEGLSPSGCWLRAATSLFGPADANLGGEFVDWVGAPSQLEKPAQEAKAPELLSEVPWDEVGTECSSSDKPAKSAGNTISYSASAISDGLLDTAWAEGQKGPGIGETVTIRLSKPMPIWGVRIWNGYQKVRDDKFGDRYDVNQRVQGVLVEWGGRMKGVDLLDRREPQDVVLDGTVGTEIRLTIRGVYKARHEDTCISEVAVLTQPDQVDRKAPDRRSTVVETAESVARKAADSMVGMNMEALASLGAAGGKVDVQFCGFDLMKTEVWEKPSCAGKDSIPQAQLASMLTQHFEEHEIYSFVAGGVKACRKGACLLEASVDTSNGEGRVHTVFVKKQGDSYVLSGIRLVTNR